MKKLAVTFAVIAAMIMCSVSVYADMGIPSQSDFTVAVGLEGCSTYESIDDLKDGIASGHIDGGVAFYVYDDYDGTYFGTTETAKDPKNFDSFVYVYPGDTLSSNENIPPEMGEDLDETIDAETTDALNLRIGPGTGFKIIRTLKKGESVSYSTTIQTDGEWAYVSAGKDYGWVSAKYLNIKKKTKKSAATEENNDKSGNDDEVKPEEKAADEGSIDPSDNSLATEKDKKYLVAGVICICVGAAILIAVFAAYLLRKRRRAY